MIVVFSGLPGAGKSYKLGQVLVSVLYRNKYHYEKQMKAFNVKAAAYAAALSKAKLAGIEQAFCLKHKPPQEPVKRVLWTNLRMRLAVEQEFEGYIRYWADLRELTPLRDVDVAIDEIGTYFDSRLWETLSLEMRRWLAQHRKFGIEIYGTAQDFAQCDKAFRRLTSNLFLLKKLIGSPDISPTRPAPKYIWGLVVMRELDPTTYDEEKSKKQMEGLPSLMFIGRQGTEIFDTRAEVRLSSALPLKHIEKECEDPNCSFHKTIHV